VFAMVVAFVALLGFGLIADAPDTSIDQSLSEGRVAEAPGFDLDVLAEGGSPTPAPLGRAVADGRISLSELRGAPVVLNFWASWCAPCREEGALLARTAAKYQERNVAFVGINMQDNTDDALEFIASPDFGNRYTHVRDPTDSTADEWGVTGLPETFFLSPEGAVTGHAIGVVTPGQLRAGIASAVAGRPLPTSAGGASRPTR
jgi:cytochrome c biogenesis protein CcmG, thiol:disulfide interchange protein DsbE